MNKKPPEEVTTKYSDWECVELDFTGPWNTPQLPHGHRYAGAAIDRGSSEGILEGFHTIGGDAAVETYENYLLHAPSRPKIVRTDPGPEFNNGAFKRKVKETEAVYKPTPRGENNQVAKVEALFRELYCAARSMLNQALLLDEFGL